MTVSDEKTSNDPHLLDDGIHLKTPYNGIK
jgi:hypothetical protein